MQSFLYPYYTINENHSTHHIWMQCRRALVLVRCAERTGSRGASRASSSITALVRRASAAQSPASDKSPAKAEGLAGSAGYRPQSGPRGTHSGARVHLGVPERSAGAHPCCWQVRRWLDPPSQWVTRAARPRPKGPANPSRARRQPPALAAGRWQCASPSAARAAARHVASHAAGAPAHAPCGRSPAPRAPTRSCG